MVSTTIALSDQEMELARRVAFQLHGGARARGVPDAHGARPGDVTLEDEVGAAAAELAASKILSVKWTAAEPNAPLDGPDIGIWTQVRHVRKPSSKCLIIRPWDIQKYGNVPFVLMRRQGNEFTAKGWIMAREAERFCSLTDKRNGRPPAWFVHESELHRIEELRDV